MKALRYEEEWARAIVRETLGVPVTQHDDGSAPGMHDLAFTYPDGRTGAVEITAAADEPLIKLWNEIYHSHGGHRWVDDRLRGGWLVTVEPIAMVKRLLVELPILLGDLESLGIHALDELPRHDPLAVRARELWVVSALQSSTDYPGSVYLLPDHEQSGALMSVTQSHLADWIGDFLRVDRPRVVKKLARSGATEKHAFVIVPGFTTAPDSVATILMLDNVAPPHQEPRLPPPVTHVWLMSAWSTRTGFRWSSRTGWLTFKKATDGFR